MTDYFADKAASWDMNQVRAAAARAFIATALELAGEAARGDVLDFGCGTGRVGLAFAPLARRVVFADASPAMLDVLREKLAANGIANAALHADGIETLPDASAGLIVSLMALHHIDDIPAVLEQFRRVCRGGGQVIIGEVVSEDGGFHAPNVVPHNGFAPEELGAQFTAAGFTVAAVRHHHTMRKPVAGGALRDFPLFTLQARG